MRALLVYHFFAHYRKAVLEELMNSRVEWHFAADETSEEIDKSIKVYIPQGKFHRLRTKRVCGKTYRLIGILGIVRRVRPDVVVFLGDVNNLTLWWVSLPLRMVGIKIYFWAHGWIDQREGSEKLLARRFFCSLSNGMLLYGHRARWIASRNGVDPGKLHVIYNSLDYSQQESVRELLRLRNWKETFKEYFRVDPPNEKAVLCFGRLTKVKRFDLVIEALASMGKSAPAVLFLGDGPAKDELSQRSISLGVNAYFLGECYDESTIGAAFAASTVVVSPGNVGLTAMHSMAYGVPVITHDDGNKQMPEAEAVMQGVTGYLFEHANADSLCKAIKLHLEQTPEMLESMRLRCIEIIEHFFNARTQKRLIEAAIEGRVNNSKVDSCLGELRGQLP